MVKPFDMTKFRKTVHKNLGITPGWHDPQMWIDTGNYALNMMISNDFFKGIPLGKVTVLAGESGSGKSYIASGTIVKNCQARGIRPIILDSEFALDKVWIEALGVDADNVDRFPCDTIDEVAKFIGDFMKQYEEGYEGVPIEEREPIMFIIDSIGMLQTPTEVDQFDKGDMKGDMGRKAKQLKALVTRCLKLFGPHNVGLIATNHTYKSQDMFNPDDVISGGQGFIYASSIIIAMQKLKLKTDENGVKTTEVHGIRSKIKCVKSRFAKPFEEVEVEIPYATGMSPYSGLFDFFEKRGKIKAGGYCKLYIGGEEITIRKKEITHDHWMALMTEYMSQDDNVIGEGVGTELPSEEELEKFV